MSRSTVNFLSCIWVFVQLANLVELQPVPKTQWELVNSGLAGNRYPLISEPQVATFSDGGYVIVYKIMDYYSDAAVGRIFAANGSALSNEFFLAGASGNHSAPNVVVFSDDTFLTAWVDVDNNEVKGHQFNKNGVSQSGVYSLSIANLVIGPDFEAAIVDLAVFQNDDYIVVYPSFDIIVFTLYPNKQQTRIDYWMWNAQTQYSRPRIVADIASNMAYIVSSYNANGLLATQFNVTDQVRGGVSFSLASASPQFLVPVLAAPNVLSMFWHSTLEYESISPSIGHSYVTVPGLSVPYPYNYTVVNSQDGNYGSYNPSVLNLGNGRVLVAYDANRFDSLNALYRMVRVGADLNGFVKAIPVGPEAYETSYVSSIRMAALVGSSDILVVAKDSYSNDILRRVLTFCGNSFVDLNEQCDGTAFCSSNCECEQNTISRNGLCVTNCGDGVVTGSEECDSSDASCSECRCAAGYQPQVPRRPTCQSNPPTFRPSVGPTLDCVAVDGPSLIAYFSYLNEDGFSQIIPEGALNAFFPSGLGEGRPTTFNAGASLTFPVSPYIMSFSSEVPTFSWVLGQFNLTVDLSNVTALQCPRDPSFIVAMLTNDLLTDELVQLFLNNFAARYGVDVSRLSAIYILNNPPNNELRSVTQDDGYVPVYDYTITVTISRANSSEDRGAEEVMTDFFNDLKNETRRNEVVTDLTQGLEAVNPQVKEVTPAPTGVSVRSNKYDAPEPIAVNTPFDSNVPRAGEVSDAYKWTPAAVLAVILLALVL